MADFTVPTLSQIQLQIMNDIDAALPNADALLTFSVLNVVATVLAGAIYALYAFISWVALQIFPDTAEDDYMQHWAAIWGVNPTSAVSASGNWIITGTVNGTDIPNNTQIQRSDGALFVTTEDAEIESGTATITIAASVPGSAGNTAPGSTLTLVTPIVNVNAAGVVDGSGLNGGIDDESSPSLLNRLLNRIQNPPQGGSANDYIQWALACAGVTRAWSYPQELGAGCVTVRFMMDDSYANGIPESSDVTNVQNYIDPLAPVTADVTVIAPIPETLNFTIHLNGASSALIEAAIIANLQEYITTNGSPACTLYLSQINQAIASATGVVDHVLSSPSSNVVYTTGQIPVMGTITWS